MKVITIVNRKGGVGKTTTAQAIGNGLLLKGYKILFIDLDSQGNLTYCTGAKNSDGILYALTKKTALNDIIQATQQGDIVGSCEQLANIGIFLNDFGKEYRLLECIEKLNRDYDFIIIDTPANLDILTINALVSSDYAIIPAEADAFSIQGLLLVNETIETVKKHCNSKLQLAGILLTKCNMRTILAKDMMDNIKNISQELDIKVFSSHIRGINSIKEAQAMKSNLLTYDKKSGAAADYMAFLDELLSII